MRYEANYLENYGNLLLFLKNSVCPFFCIALKYSTRQITQKVMESLKCYII